MTAKTPRQEEKQQPQQFIAPTCGQKISPSGRIHISKKAWAVRIFTILATSVLVIYAVYLAILSGDLFLITGVIIPAHSLAYLVIGWVLFRSPAVGKLGNDLVTVIVPVYNQKSMIEIVIDAIFRSTYPYFEVIAVNDGSIDGTK